MALTEDDPLWRDQNFPNMSDEQFQKIVDTFGGNSRANESKQNEKYSAKIAFETVKKEAYKLFVDEYGTPYIALIIEGHLEIFPIASNRFEDWYRMFVYEQKGIILESETINKLCSLARAYAASPKHGEQIPLSLERLL